MAKKKKDQEQLRTELVLDLDAEFAPGLKRASNMSKSEGASMNATVGQIADKLAARYLTVNTAIGFAKKGYKEFVDKALELEKKGGGNEGTAAIARISAAADRMWTSFVRAAT